MRNYPHLRRCREDVYKRQELAYAITVHKSQGSEFTAVVMPMYQAHRNLLSRNLFYTAVTRAKELVVLVGREDIVRYMTDNNYEDMRYCGLKELLCEAIPPLKENG